MSNFSKLQLVKERLQFVRGGYTLKILEDVDDADWFRAPENLVTHIAWQVGHLAMAQYRLGIERLRPAKPEDEQLISADFLATFGKGSAPQADASAYPTPAEIRTVAAGVNEQMLSELDNYNDEDLEANVLAPHQLFNKKIESLFWCADHELTHAGQISLLRRLLGKDPKW